jgi:hypothetical protein
MCLRCFFAVFSFFVLDGQKFNRSLSELAHFSRPNISVFQKRKYKYRKNGQDLHRQPARRQLGDQRRHSAAFREVRNRLRVRGHQKLWVSSSQIRHRVQY